MQMKTKSRFLLKNIYLNNFSSFFFLILGVIKEDGTIDNAESIDRISQVALAYAKAGNNTQNNETTRIQFNTQMWINIQTVIYTQIQINTKVGKSRFEACELCLILAAAAMFSPIFNFEPRTSDLQHNVSNEIP